MIQRYHVEDYEKAEQGMWVCWEDYLAALAAEFERGIQEGQAKQAILELRGRDKFLDEIRAKHKTALAGEG